MYTCTYIYTYKKRERERKRAFRESAEGAEYNRRIVMNFFE